MTKVFINETLNENVIILPTEQGAIVTITASGAPGVTDHAALSNLTYATAGHTGFEPSLPSMVGASLKFLQVNLTENAKQWTTVTMTPAGADTQVQFNDGGSFGANANFTFLTATERFGVGLTTPLATGHFKRPSGYAEVRVEGVAAGSGALVTVQNDLGAGWYLAAFGSTNAGSFFFGLPNAGGCIASINAGVETWMGIGVTTAIPFIIGTNNVERERFLPAGGTNRNLTEYHYLAALATADAVGDWRYSNQAGALNFDYCSVLNAAKGVGTWNTMLGMAANVVTYKAGQIWKPSADSTGAFKFQRLSDSAEILNIDTTNARVSIGMTSPLAKLQSLGNLYVTNQITAGLISENSTYILSGGPNTKVLIVKGTNYTSAGGNSRFVAMGYGTNTIAYSADGITWTGIGTSIFSTYGLGVAWNGTRFVAVGQGTNTIAYSADGITWTGIGTSIFSTYGFGVAWNGTRFVAVGAGTNSIAYSADGITWTGIGTSIFSTQGTGVAWNGTRFVAVGQGTNSIAYSSDGITWTGIGTSIFSSYGFGVASAPAPELIPAQGTIGGTTTYQAANLQEWQDGGGNLLSFVDALGGLSMSRSTNSVTAYNFKDASGTSILNIDSINSRVGLGTISPDTLLSLINNNWISAKDFAGTSYVNMLKVNISDTIDVGATLNLRTGTATAGTSPLRFTAGVNLTVPVTGAMEYDGTSFFLTRLAAQRETVGTVLTKTDTGDPIGAEGLFCINTFDNNFKVYGEGAWRTLATW